MLFNRLIFLFSIVFLLSCQNSKQSADPTQIVKDYYAELNEANLDEAAALITDNITMYEFDFAQVNGKEDWVRQFKWDSVFSPTYEIIDIKEVNGTVDVTISKNCRRIRYLQDKPTIFKEVFEFEDGKISSEKIYEYIVFDFETWQSRRDTLVKWIDNNHPELSGFIYDQTFQGGHNYLMAIDYYEKQQ